MLTVLVTESAVGAGFCGAGAVDAGGGVGTGVIAGVVAGVVAGIVAGVVAEVGMLSSVVVDEDT